jgi:DNA-binding transcriptional regulator YiaG
MRARFVHISPLIEEFGLERVREPHVKHLRGPLWEMRMKGKDGISRALYVTALGRRVIVVRAFIKKTQKTPNREIELAPEFALAHAVIEARVAAGLTEEQLAERMHTTQSVIARLESGRTRPSTQTLERLAAATGTRLKISFEPEVARP